MINQGNIFAQNISTIKMDGNFNNKQAQFQEFLDHICKIDWRKNLRVSIKKLHLESYKLESMTPKIVRSTYLNLLKKYQKIQQQNQRINWFQGELKIFIWLLLANEKIFTTPIKQYSEFQVSKLSLFFFKIKQDICFYQYKILIENRNDDFWSEQESQLLSKIVKQFNFKGSWTTISKQLFLQSKKEYLRAAHICRQRWQNHLDCRLVKGKWTLEQDYIIIKQRSIHNKKWAQIAKIFNSSRTQHMIKNRFNAILKKQCFIKQISDQKTQYQIMKQLETKLFIKLNSKTCSYNDSIATYISSTKIQSRSQCYNQFQQTKFNQIQQGPQIKHLDLPCKKQLVTTSILFNNNNHCLNRFPQNFQHDNLFSQLFNSSQLNKHIPVLNQVQFWQPASFDLMQEMEEINNDLLN